MRRKQRYSRTLMGLMVGAACVLWTLCARAQESDSVEAAGVTKDEAIKFWKDFDGQTLGGAGPEITKVYGNVMPTEKYRKDLGGFMSAGSLAISIQIREVHGLPVTDEMKKALAKAYKDLKDNGAFARLSKLQLLIIEKHFKLKDGGIDFEKFQLATELFANGELATHKAGEEGEREMDQLYQWFLWEKVAEAMIKEKVDDKAWEKLIKSLETGLEIYRVVYPARPPAQVGLLPIQDSRAERFDKAKQRTPKQIEDLRKEIMGLSLDDLLKRAAKNLKELTPLEEEKDVADAALASSESQGASTVNVRFVQLEVTPVDDGFEVDVTVAVTDGSGLPVTDALVGLLAGDNGFEVPSQAFSLGVPLENNNAAGMYSASFFATPVTVTGFNLWALEERSLESATASISLGLPDE